MNITTQQLNEILARKPIAKRNSSGDTGLRSAEPQPTQGHALERVVSRKTKGRTGPVERYRITFVVYAVRPCDWDGYHVKEIQDMLVHASILSGDDWRILEGLVRSQKAESKNRERTEIFIEPIEPLTTAQPSR